MNPILAAVALAITSVQFAVAQSPGLQPGVSIGIAGGPRQYLSGTERRTGSVQVFVRQTLTPTFACEGELVGGGGSDDDIHLPEMEGGRPVVTHFAANLGVNLVYRTRGRFGLLAIAGPGLYVEQRDTELRTGGTDAKVLERNNTYTFGVQGSAGLDIKLGAAGLFTVLRYEARALRSADKLKDWQVLVGVHFPAPW